ncbi:hypothetical protein BX600DRAFT_434523 [Xylariales sp. PMI_506]|nr:hypothetical protein BX600DRAFT_434523 [Xylariales sp. PMI_506]
MALLSDVERSQILLILKKDPDLELVRLSQIKASFRALWKSQEVRMVALFEDGLGRITLAITLPDSSVDVPESVELLKSLSGQPSPNGLYQEVLPHLDRMRPYYNRNEPPYAAAVYVRDLESSSTPRDEYLKRLTNHRVWSIQPHEKTETGTGNWARCIISEEFPSNSELLHRLEVLGRDKSSVTERKLALDHKLQAQISHLVKSVQESEADPNYSWSLNQLAMVQTKNKIFRDTQRLSAIIVYLCRAPLNHLDLMVLYEKETAHQDFLGPRTPVQVALDAITGLPAAQGVGLAGHGSSDSYSSEAAASSDANEDSSSDELYGREGIDGHGDYQPRYPVSPILPIPSTENSGYQGLSVESYDIIERLILQWTPSNDKGDPDKED